MLLAANVCHQWQQQQQVERLGNLERVGMFKLRFLDFAVFWSQSESLSLLENSRERPTMIVVIKGDARYDEP